MNLRQIRCFDAVMSLGTVTEAATALGVSQPAASIALAALERELGFRLFERSNGRLKPTPEARFFLEDAKSILGAVERASQTARAIRSSTQGNLVIACFPGIALDFLPRLLTPFLKARPGVRVELLSRSSHVIHELIPSQRFDVAVADLPVNRPDVTTMPMRLACVCVLPRDHPLAGRPVVTPADLDGMPFCSLFNEHVIHYRVANAFAAANAQWNVVVECRFFATACAFVAEGLGASIVDPITARSFDGDRVKAVPFEPAIIYEIGILLPTGRTQSLLTRSFVEVLATALEPFAMPSPVKRNRGRTAAEKMQRLRLRKSL